MCDRCECSGLGIVESAALSGLAEASKLYRVRHVRTGRYLSVDGWRGETPLSKGAFSAAWAAVPGFACGDWDRRAALGLAKVWIALTGDADVEIEEVAASWEGGAPHG